MKKIAVSLILGLMLTMSLVVAGRQGNKFGLPENAVEVAPGVFDLGKGQDVDGTPVRGYAFVHYAKGYEPEVSATELSDCYSIIWAGIKWDTAEDYLINPTNNAGLEDDNILTAFETSVETWEDALEVNADIIGLGTITTEKNNGRRLDGINTVRFGGLPRGVIAMNIIWTDGTSLVEWDQVYNDRQFDWSEDCLVDDCTTKMDFQNIATHELGHAVGLGDLYNLECDTQTMYGYSEYGETSKRDLAYGDIAGIKALYG